MDLATVTDAQAAPRGALLRVLAVERLKCEADPWYFITKYVVTQDEHDHEHPEKPFPDRPYLESLCRAVVSRQLLAIPKSRQMMVTWLCCAIAVWLVIFRRAQRVAIQSKKKEDASELLARALFIYDHLPEFLRDQEQTPSKNRNTSEARFPSTGGILWALPEGGDQIRQYTVSWWFCDEAAFQPELEDAWAAALPSIKGGGRATLVSSLEYSFFNDLIEGEAPAPGLEVMPVHFTAHPPYREAEWVKESQRGMLPEKWAREYDMRLTARGGKAIYGGELGERHWVAPFPIPGNWPRMRGIDPGLRNAATLWLAVDPRDRQVVVYREMLRHEEALRVWSTEIKRLSAYRAEDGKLKGEDYALGTLCDPAGNARAQDGDKSIVEQLGERGIGCALWKNPVAAGINRVKDYLLGRTKAGRPAVVFFDHLVELKREFKLYRWKRRPERAASEGTEPEEPVKANDHLLDCLRGMLMARPDLVVIETETKAPTLEQALEQDWRRACGELEDDDDYRDLSSDPVLGVGW